MTGWSVRRCIIIGSVEVCHSEEWRLGATTKNLHVQGQSWSNYEILTCTCTCMQVHTCLICLANHGRCQGVSLPEFTLTGEAVSKGSLTP